MKTLTSTSMTCLLASGLAGVPGVYADTATHSEPMRRSVEVLQVTPIHQTVATEVPEQRCWKRYRTIPAAGEAGTDGAARALTRRCNTVERRESRQEIVAYRVKYRYRGRIYHARTAQRPGQQIRVDHRLEPVHF